MIRRGEGRPNGELGTAVRLLEQRLDQNERSMQERHDQTQSMVRELRDAVTAFQAEVRSGNSTSAIDNNRRTDEGNHELQRLGGRIDDVEQRLNLLANNVKWAIGLCALTSAMGGAAVEIAKTIWHF